MNKNYNNNIFIIASRALFQQSPTCTRVNNLVYIWQQSHTHGSEVLIMFYTWKRFSQWICDIQICMYFANLQISICYIISDYMKPAVDMLGLWMISIINSGVWKPILTPTHSSMIISDEPRCQDSINPIYIFPSARDILLARDFIVDAVIPSSISFTASTLLVS